MDSSLSAIYLSQSFSIKCLSFALSSGQCIAIITSLTLTVQSVPTQIFIRSKIARDHLKGNCRSHGRCIPENQQVPGIIRNAPVDFLIYITTRVNLSSDIASNKSSIFVGSAISKHHLKEVTPGVEARSLDINPSFCQCGFKSRRASLPMDYFSPPHAITISVHTLPTLMFRSGST